MGNASVEEGEQLMCSLQAGASSGVLREWRCDRGRPGGAYASRRLRQ
jgi:hypothetical protein